MLYEAAQSMLHSKKYGFSPQREPLVAVPAVGLDVNFSLSEQALHCQFERLLRARQVLCLWLRRKDTWRIIGKLLWLRFLPSRANRACNFRKRSFA